MTSSAPVYSIRFRIVAALVVALAAGAFFIAYRGFQDGTDDPIVQSGGAGDYVESFTPARNDQVLAQSTVQIDLIPSWTGTLVINGVEVPADELQVTDELGLVQYTPGEGRTIEELRTGTNTVNAIVWPRAGSRETGAETVTWTFEVV